jgi:phosphonate transport system substrate-binding protein
MSRKITMTPAVSTAAFVLTSIVMFAANVAAGDGSLKFGVTPREAPKTMFQKFTPLARYLSKELGTNVELTIGKDFQTTIDGLGKNEFSVALLTPSAYPKCQQLYPDAGVQPVARFLTGGTSTYTTCIFVPADSKISSLSELKGKTFAFGDATSAASHLMPRLMLIEAGVNGSDLADSKYLGSHTNVASAVAVKTYDAGACMDSVAERFEKEGKIKIIARSPEMPDAPICVNKNIDPQMAQKIAAALLKLKASDAEGREVLTSINEKYTGCEPAAAKDYDSIRNMMMKVDIGGK